MDDKISINDSSSRAGRSLGSLLRGTNQRNILDIEPTHNYIMRCLYLYLIILQEFEGLDKLNSRINYKIEPYDSF